MFIQKEKKKKRENSCNIETFVLMKSIQVTNTDLPHTSIDIAMITMTRNAVAIKSNNLHRKTKERTNKTSNALTEDAQ